MKRVGAVLALTIFVLGITVPIASADVGGWVNGTKDKTIRGIENGVFGMGGELYHHIKARSGWSWGVVDGLCRGAARTAVGAYEIATPYYHDAPILSDLDTIL